MLDSAKDLNDFRVPPGDRLEKRAGDRRGIQGRRNRRLPLRKEHDNGTGCARFIPAKSCVKSFCYRWECRPARYRRRFTSRPHGSTTSSTRHFGNSPEFWLNLQAAYDLRAPAAQRGRADRARGVAARGGLTCTVWHSGAAQAGENRVNQSGSVALSTEEVRGPP
jgi:hypothetical protein